MPKCVCHVPAHTAGDIKAWFDSGHAAPARLDADAEAQRAQHVGPAQRARRARRQLALVQGALQGEIGGRAK